MSARLVLLLALVATAALPGAASAQRRIAPIQSLATPAGGSVPGAVIVQFKAGVAASARGSLRRAADVNVVRAMYRSGQQLLRVQSGQTVDEAIRELERDSRVAFAQKNWVYRANAVPNDPAFGQLWGQLNSGQAVRGVPGVAGLAGDDTDATAAWNRSIGRRSILGAVTGTGSAYDHPDLAANISSTPGADFIDFDGDPRDLNEHGTHVAGTIGAVGNNATGVAGMNWQVSLMAVRVLGASGSGSSQSVADGFNYAGDHGARVVNASLGGNADPGDTVVSDAITNHPNTLYVVSAGNGGPDGIGDDNELVPQTPCNFTAANLVCVAATTQSDGLASFSNFGTTSVDLGAPGTNILSTVPRFIFQDGLEGGLSNWTTPPTPWQLTSSTSAGGSFSAADSPGNYAPSADEILQTAGAVPGAGGCPLSFDLRMQVPDSGDRLFVETSTNGTTWSSLGSISGDFGPGFFTVGAGDLPSGPNLFIRFHFIADADGSVGDGAYVDNVRVGCVDTTPAYDGSEFAFLDGTSMASPQVAGAAALALSLKPSASVAELKSALLSSGDPIPALNGKTVSGRRLNVASLLDTVSPPPSPPPPPPTPIPARVAKTLADVKVSRCKQSGSGKRRRLRCTLRSADAVTSASLTLKKGHKTIAKGTAKPKSGALSLKLKRKLRKGRYTLTLVLRDAARHKRTMTFRFRVT